MNDMAFDEASDLFDYCPETGHLSWKVLTSGRKNPITTLSKFGYVVVSVGGKQYKVHRIIWTLVNGRPTTLLIDHINRCKSDNRISNLREATEQQNSANVAQIRANTRSGRTGIRQQSGRSRWEARLSYGGKSHFLGAFATKEEAIAARVAASRAIHGDFAP